MCQDLQLYLLYGLRNGCLPEGELHRAIDCYKNKYDPCLDSCITQMPKLMLFQSQAYL